MGVPKNLFTALFTCVMLVLGIAQVQFFPNTVLNLPPLFMVVFAAAIVSDLLLVGHFVRRGVRLSIYSFLLTWVVKGSHPPHREWFSAR